MPFNPNSGSANNDNKVLPTKPAKRPIQDTPPDNPLGIGFPVSILKTLPLLNIPISDENVSAAAAANTANPSKEINFPPG